MNAPKQSASTHFHDGYNNWIKTNVEHHGDHLVITVLRSDGANYSTVYKFMDEPQGGLF